MDLTERIKQLEDVELRVNNVFVCFKTLEYNIMN